MDFIFLEEDGNCTEDFCVYPDDDHLKLIIHEKAEISLDVLKQMYRLVKRAGGRKPLLICLQPEMNLGKEARDYIHKLNSRYQAPPVAVITDTFNEMLIANFYKKFYKPASPYRIFKKEKDASSWLKEMSMQ